MSTTMRCAPGGRRRQPAWTAGVLMWLAVAPALAQTGETVGVITEIKVGRGRAELRTAGASEWRPAGPLAALRAGDSVRVADGATVVVLLAGGRGTVTVDAARSPYTVPAAPAGDSRMEKARALVEAGVGYLASRPPQSPKAVLAVRSITRPPVVVSPRNGPALPGPLVLEWIGTGFSRYTVKVLGPGGVIFQRSGVSGAQLEYPADAPRLVSGPRYRLQVQLGTQPPQEAWFEVVDAARAQAVRRDVEALDHSVPADVSATTRAALTAGLLAHEGLLHDARRAVLTALARDPEEPTLHQLLGNLYAQVGLAQLADEAYDEAQALLTRRGK